MIGVDLAKDVYQLAVADRTWQVRETHRLSRAKFEAFFVNRAVSLVVMEACGSAHHGARWLNGLGIEVVLLPVTCHVSADQSFLERPPISRLNIFAARTRSGSDMPGCYGAGPRCNAVATAR